MCHQWLSSESVWLCDECILGFGSCLMTVVMMLSTWFANENQCLFCLYICTVQHVNSTMQFNVAMFIYAFCWSWFSLFSICMSWTCKLHTLPETNSLPQIGFRKGISSSSHPFSRAICSFHLGYTYLEPKWSIFWKIRPTKMEGQPQKAVQMGSICIFFNEFV